MPYEGSDRATRRQLSILYPSLRVGLIEVKVEGVRSLPPALISPSGMKALDLKIECSLSPFETGKTESLTKFASKLTVHALQQGGTSYPFTGQSFQLKVGNGSLKVALKGFDRLGGFCTPSLSPSL